MDLSRPLRGTILQPEESNGDDSAGPDVTTVDEGEGGLVAEETEQIWTQTDTVVCIHALLGTLAWLVVS